MSSDAEQAAPFKRGKPTMADVAARVGVSRALVSLVFRDEPGASTQTRARVLQAAEELGYRPDNAARMLARSRSRLLGVLATVRNPFHADLVEGSYPIAEELGYDILLSPTGPTRDERKAVETLLSHRCEALVLLGPASEAGYLAALSARVPLVLVGRAVAGVDAVHTAEAKGARQAVNHLVELGHRSIVHIDGGRGPGSAERRRGYREAMRRHGLGDFVRVLPGDHTEASGTDAVGILLADNEMPTAVFAGNDRCAFGVLHGLRRAGLRIPDDVSVVGYDDNHLAQLAHVDLTTVRQDAARQAELAVRVAVERTADGSRPARDLVLDPNFVVRATTAPPHRG